jgi:hypothetical protein
LSFFRIFFLSLLLYSALIFVSTCRGKVHHLVYPSRLITAYPEFRELLERIHGLINEGKYNAVSLILRDEISSFCINTRHRDEFEKLLTLIHIDAALDFFCGIIDGRV